MAGVLNSRRSAWEQEKTKKTGPTFWLLSFRLHGQLFAPALPRRHLSATNKDRVTSVNYLLFSDICKIIMHEINHSQKICGYNKKQPKRRWHLRSFWLKVHLYIALTVGFIFVILGLTGSFNVFYSALEESSLPEVHKEANAQPLKLDEVLRVVKAAHPQKNGRWSIFLPGYDRDYIWAVYPKPEETAGQLFAPLRVLIDPYTGKIIAEHFWGRTLWSLIYEVHASFLTGRLSAELGEIGFKTVSFLGLFLFASVLTGLYLGWPKQGKFKHAVTIKRNASPQRFYFDLHRSIGFYSSIILLIIALTGFVFGYKDYIKPLMVRFSAVKKEHFKDPAEIKSIVIAEAQPISIEQAVAIADQVFPGAELRWLATPEGKEGVYAIEKRQPGEANRRRPRSKVWIDQYTGKVLAVEDPNQFSFGETFFNLVWPLHNGEAFGFTGRVLWCISGFVPLILYISGLIRWLQKRKAHKLRRQ